MGRRDVKQLLCADGGGNIDAPRRRDIDEPRVDEFDVDDDGSADADRGDATFAAVVDYIRETKRFE